MSERYEKDAERLSLLMDSLMEPAVKALAAEGVATIVIAADVGEGSARTFLSNTTNAGTRQLLLQALQRLDLLEQSEKASTASA